LKAIVKKENKIQPNTISTIELLLFY